MAVDARVRTAGASRRARPVQHAERAKGVPAARLAGVAFHLEVHRTRVRILERPSPVRVTLLRHQRDRLGGALVWHDARSAQVVETPQDVVVPASGKRTLRPRGGPPEFPVEVDNLSSRSRSEEAALEEIVLSAKASAGHVRHRTLCRLVLQQSFEHADRRMERRPLAARGVAVPAAVAQLLLKESVDETMAGLAEIRAGRKHPSVDTGFDLAFEERRVAELLA